MSRGSGGMRGGNFMPNRPSGRMGGSGGFGGSSSGSGGYNPYSGSGGKSRMSGSGMGSGFGGGGGINFETYRPVAKKLVRFVDFTAETGHKYRYRVRVVLEDPNHPRDPDMEPEPTALDETVRERIKKRLKNEETAESLAKWARDTWTGLQRGAGCEPGAKDTIENVLLTLMAGAKASEHILISQMAKLEP